MKLPGLLWSCNYYSFLAVQVGSNEDIRRSLRAIKRDFLCLVEGMGAQVMFSSIPSVARKNTEKQENPPDQHTT